jgi:hypothetical protein
VACFAFDSVPEGQLSLHYVITNLTQALPTHFQRRLLRPLVVAGGVHILTRRIADIPKDDYKYRKYQNDASGQIVKARIERSKNARLTEF